MGTRAYINHNCKQMLNYAHKLHIISFDYTYIVGILNIYTIITINVILLLIFVGFLYKKFIIY